TSLERVPTADPSPVKLYRNRDPLPPVFLVPRTILADDAQALAYLRDVDFSPARVATVALGPNARALDAADEGRTTNDQGGAPPSSSVLRPSSADPPVRVLER